MPPDFPAELRLQERRKALAVYFRLVTVSHGVFDAMTNGGLGIAFFSPFSNARYFLPWTPLEVSPIGRYFFSARGVEVLVSELLWGWQPMTAVCAGLALARRKHTESSVYWIEVPLADNEPAPWSLLLKKLSAWSANHQQTR